MSSEKKSMLKPLLIYAGILFGISVLQTILADVFGFMFSRYYMWIGLGITFIVLFYIFVSYRKEYCNDTAKYGELLGFGVLLMLIVSVLNTAFSYVYTHYISPELIELGQAYAEERMMARGLSDDIIEQQLAQQQKFGSFFWTMLFGVLGGTFFGTIISAIVAAFAKKEPKNPFEGVE
jgi:hypothetical protein